MDNGAIWASIRIIITMNWNSSTVFKSMGFYGFKKKSTCEYNWEKNHYNENWFLKRQWCSEVGEETSLYPVFPLWTLPLCNQIVDEVIDLFIDVFQPINEKEIINLEYHNFAICDELTDLDTKYQWLLTS